jgi:hypothetical protein
VCRFLYTPGGSQLVNIPAAKVIISSNAIEIAICGLDRSITVTFKPTATGWLAHVWRNKMRICRYLRELIAWKTGAGSRPKVPVRPRITR